MGFDFLKKFTGPKIPPEEMRGKGATRQAQNNLKPKYATAAVADVRIWDAGRMAIVKLRPAQPLWDFKAGQYTSIGLEVPKKGFIANAYSMASSPAQKSELEFLLVLVHGGALTPTMFAAKPGDAWHYMKAVGHFHLGATRKKSLLFVATGTGVAPVRSIVKDLDEKGTLKDHRIVVANGVRWSEALAYRAEFEAWQKKYPENILYLPTVSRPQADKGFSPAFGKGRVHEVVKLALGIGGAGAALPSGLSKEKFLEWTKPEVCAPMLVGHPEMTKDMEAVLKAKGWAEVHKEDYW
ncbi:MAG: hypothetical protein K8I02_08555 [Candidatus Methylomirabilis sp.]|nr:hypothetical protein [Deltaproteobacteria bacterium]